MGINQLAEGIMIQSIEDLWDERFRKEGVDFFRGEGFTIWADLAGMNLYDQVRLMNMTAKIVERSARRLQKAPRDVKRLKAVAS